MVMKMVCMGSCVFGVCFGIIKRQLRWVFGVIRMEVTVWGSWKEVTGFRTLRM